MTVGVSDRHPSKSTLENAVGTAGSGESVAAVPAIEMNLRIHQPAETGEDLRELAHQALPPLLR